MDVPAPHDQGLRGHGLQSHEGEGPTAAGRRGRLGRHARRPWPRRSDVVFAIVGFPKDVREVFLGPEGVLAGSKPGTALVDMTTSEPSLAQEIYEAAKAKGVARLDAPVSGGDVGASNAALSIMVGGDADVVEAVRPLLGVHGQDDRPSGRRRRRPAHQDGEPDPDCHQHDRRVRGAALRLQGGPRTSRRCCSRSAAGRRRAGR